MKKLIALLGALFAFLALAAPAAAQEEGDEAPAPAADAGAFSVLHRVDAVDQANQLWLVTGDYSAGATDVTVTIDGAAATVDKVSTAAAAGAPGQVVFVLDTRNDLAGGDHFATMTRTVAAEILALPDNVEVGVVAASDSAIVVSSLSRDHRSVAREVQALEMSSGSRLYNSLDRAASLFGDDAPSGFRSVVVVSGGADTGSTIVSTPARTSLIRRGVQMLSVTVAGGDADVAAMVPELGGANMATSNADELGAAISAATTAAADRLIITFEGSTDLTDRVGAAVVVGGTSIDFSYPGGVDTYRLIGLDPIEPVEETGLPFFRSERGRMVSIGLVFLAIGLGVYAVGSIFAMGESSLEGLINRYSGEGDAAALTDDESAIVQTALVKRAVELSESFAEDRGFLVKIEGMLERAKLPLRAGEAMSIFAGGSFAAAVLGFFVIGGLFGSLILMAVTAFGMVGTVNFRARRRIRKFEQQLPDTLQLLAGTLRAGYSLPQGVEAVSNEIADPMGYELRRVMTEARLGRELEDSMASTAERLDSPDFAWAVMAIAIQREVGGNLNELLMTVADTMIARERLKGEVAALTAEGKMSAILLGGLPPGLGAVMWLMNPGYINVLFQEFLGNVFLGLGVVSSLIGFAWMKKVMTIDV
ncbi:MAG: type II secretion system F family protein [Acidimicrobiales bacterium]